ncbi:hypothetical protein B5M09_002023 [Aphanomyces astaci]|uniref:Thioredoxin domain-containing protein n=1 Tax=Aphanomyces astaci TaxID=112090 RepID=A0A3R8DLA3_APHAT|nr:hypothetical protein B5M09_002023 [Aphanomyces astaci]
MLLAMITMDVTVAEEAPTSTWTHKHVHEFATIAQTRASEMETSKKLWIALYGARDDPILSVLDQVGAELSYAVSFAWISADVAQSYGLQAATPPILILFRDEPKLNPYQKRMYRTLELAHQFPSRLDVRGVKRVVRDKAPSAVLTSWQDDDIAWGVSTDATTTADSTNPPRVILVTKKSSPSLLYKSLSIEFPSLRFFALAESPAVLDQFQVSSVPSLLVGPSSSSLTLFQESDGDITNVHDLRRFLLPHVPQNADPSSTAASSSSLWLSRDELDVAVRNTSAAWLVVIQSKSSPNVVDPSSDEWTHTIADLERKVGVDLIRVAMVDIPSSPSSSHGIFTVPYGPSVSLEKAPSAASLSGVAKQLVASLPDATAALYGPSDIQAFFGRMITTPNTISFVLFTAKQDTPVMVQALALSFPSQVHVGVVFHPDDQTKQQFGLSKLPAMVAVMSPRDPSVPRDQFSMTFYDKKLMGPPTYANVRRFLDQVVQAYVVPTNEPAKNAGKQKPVVHPVTSQAEFTHACTSLCVVGFTNGPSDVSTGAILNDVAAKNQHPLQFITVDAVCQREFAAALGADAWQIPTIVVYSPGKRRYVRHVGGLDVDATLAFVQSVLSGKTKTIPLSTAPALAEECAGRAEDEDAVVGNDDNEDDGDVEDMLREIREEELKQAELRKRQLHEEAEARKLAQAAADAAAAASKAKEKKKKTTKASKGKKKRVKTPTTPTKDEL